MSIIKLRCPYCKNPVEVEFTFFSKSDRICCMSCNKAFDIVEVKKNVEMPEEASDLENESFNFEEDDEY
jgi:uncharacterized protein YbaR (Trm112 family)